MTVTACALLVLTAVATQPGEERFTLDNGLRVVVKPAGAQDVAAVGILYRGGAAADPAGRVGLSVLLHRAVCRAATKSFKEGEAAARLEAEGLMPPHQEASAGFTFHLAIVRTASLDAALQIEAERMRTAAFTEGAVDRARASLLEQIADRDGHPQAELASRILALAHAGTGYRHPAHGYAEDVRSATLDDLRRLYEQAFHPANAILVLYGRAEGARALVEKHFKPLPTGTPRPLPAEDGGAVRGVRETLPPVPSRRPAQILAAWPAPPDETKEKAALLVGVYHLRLRMDLQGLQQNVVLYGDLFAVGRSIVLFNAIPNQAERLDALEAEAWKNFGSLAERPLAEADFERARTSLLNDLLANDTFPLGFAKDASQASTLLYQAAYQRLRRECAGPDRPERLRELLQRVTPAEVQEAARTVLSPDRALVILVKEKP